MEPMQSVVRGKQLSVYRFPDDEVKRFLVSTPETRLLCSDPLVMGYRMRRYVKNSIARLIRDMRNETELDTVPDSQACVLHFLRGSLNFGLIDALNKALAYNNHVSSFLTSQRYRKRGTWWIKYDQYRKFCIPDQAVIFLGDCIATGTTLENGINILIDHCIQHDIGIRSMLVFTIGCHYADGIVKRIHRRLKENFNYHHTYLFYLEGRFGIPEDGQQYRICLPGTDLVRHPALLAPEYELFQLHRWHYPLERCVIYDVGARSFDVREHLHEVSDYWQQLRNSGMTHYQAFCERWPVEEYEDYDRFLAARRPQWPDLPEPELRQMFDAYHSLWTPEFRQAAQQKNSLERLTRHRIRHLHRLQHAPVNQKVKSEAKPAEDV